MKTWLITAGIAALLGSCQSQSGSPSAGTTQNKPAESKAPVESKPQESKPIVQGKVIQILDDFEGKETNFKDSSQGSFKVTQQLVDGGKVGKRAIEITIAGEKGKGWSSFMVPLENGWPKEANRVTFWARGKEETTILLAVREGAWPDQGGHGAEIKLTKDWQHFSVALTDLTFFIWGMGEITAETKVAMDNVVSIGFAEHPQKKMPVTFTIDQFQFENVSK